MLPEVRMARVLDAISLHRAGRLSCVEAAELLGLSGPLGTAYQRPLGTPYQFPILTIACRAFGIQSILSNP